MPPQASFVVSVAPACCASSRSEPPRWQPADHAGTPASEPSMAERIFAPLTDITMNQCRSARLWSHVSAFQKYRTFL